MRPRALQRPDLLTDAFARELHRRMFNQVWRWAGRYRTTEKNLGWEVHRLTEGVRNAFDDAQYWMQHSTYPLHEAAVRLHHQLVAIHPWPNGNGRHSRLIADLLVVSRGGDELTWGARADLMGAGEIRNRYITAIRAADAGDIVPLLNFAKS
jgi:Fic-DOC domain mobile mystery protein B